VPCDCRLEAQEGIQARVLVPLLAIIGNRCAIIFSEAIVLRGKVSSQPLFSSTSKHKTKSLNMKEIGTHGVG
jgi:hypothetical protein